MAGKSISYEEAMGQLEAILETLSGPDVPLEESITLYAKAADLIAACNKQLAGAKLRIEEINTQLEASGAQDDG